MAHSRIEFAPAVYAPSHAPPDAVDVAVDRFSQLYGRLSHLKARSGDLMLSAFAGSDVAKRRFFTVLRDIFGVHMQLAEEERVVAGDLRSRAHLYQAGATAKDYERALVDLNAAFDSFAMQRAEKAVPTMEADAVVDDEGDDDDDGDNINAAMDGASEEEDWFNWFSDEEEEEESFE